ncbi:MAG: transport system ATP-binding/permease protein [Acidimicrobiaceae bacterium]|nr:transport system ATP-binding/permease protein [Acidimicrobiaceae bacterium]
MILVDLERVAARRPDRPLFEDLSLTVSTGDRLGVVGRNGTGKSTLLRVLAGVDVPEEGSARQGRDVRVGFLAQRPALPPGDVRAAVGPHWEAAAILERLGMGDLADADVSTLSGGQAKRVALAQVLVDEVDLLVLDEPTNHLDLDAIAWLEERLARFRGGLVIVTHDRHVLDRVTTRILELDRGHGYLHDGGYSAYLGAAAERAEHEATAETVRRNLARAELAWLRRGAPARTRKPKSRIAAATAIVEGRGPVVDRAGDLDLAGGGQWGTTPRLGTKVIELHGVGHGFADQDDQGDKDNQGAQVDQGDPGDRRLLFEDLDLDLGPGDRLGLVGANGSGKSTLLDLIAARLTPLAGSVETGPTVRLGYYDQTGRDLDPALRVREAVAGPLGQPNWEQARLMERFWFDSDAQWAPVGTLSGGEQRRLQLLLVLATLPNVLLLDEPSNDLDLDTLRALEDYLDAWPGTVVVASHDRAFLERTVEEVLVLDGKGRAAVAPGGYAGYAASRLASGPRGVAPSTGARRPKAPMGGASGRHTAGTDVGGGPVTVSAPSREAVSAPARAAASSPPAAPAGSGVSASGKVRSSSTVRRLVGLAEREMVEAAGRRDSLVAELSAGNADHSVVTEVAHALAAAEVRLAQAEERWLTLSEELGT